MAIEMTVLVISLLLFLAIGIHIGIALGISGLLYIVLFTDFSLGMLAPTFFKSVNSITLMTIPLFVMAGFAMEQIGIVDKLFRFATSLLGWLPAGAGVATMFCSVIFAAISGSSVASASAMGVLAVPPMRKLGYPRDFIAGLIAVGGTLAILIPPSLSMIVFGIATENSIPRLFLAGVIPGIMLGTALCANIAILGKIHGMKGSNFRIRELGSSTASAFWGLIMPVMVLGGIYGGIFTPTEAGGIAAFYAICYGVITMRSDGVKALKEAVWQTLETSAMVFLIMGGAYIFGMVLTLEKIPDMLAQAIVASNMPRWAFLISLNIFYLILGCFLDVISSILLTMPFIYPITTAMGIDPLHFATFLTINMEIACITPPVGFNLYVLAGVSNTPIANVIKGVFPFILVLLSILILVTWIPQLSTWLPSMMMN